MKQVFQEISFTRKSKEKLSIINSIIDDYTEQGHTLTVRQIYYQLVSKNVIPNNKNAYTNLSNLLTKGRMAGVIDWEAIEDRSRNLIFPYAVDGIREAMGRTIRGYRLNRQQNQSTYMEVWCEKDALSGVLRRITINYHMPLVIAKGYNSTTSMFDAHSRFLLSDNIFEDYVILYFGDHDPSGLCMVKDVERRLKRFGIDVEIVRVALTKDQVEQYNIPPNLTKMSDTRAKKYIEEYGTSSYEVDALPPNILIGLLEHAIESRLDFGEFNTVIEQEEQDKAKLGKMKDLI